MTGCPDCPHRCPSRGRSSRCDVERPGRVWWRGVTVLEEHELAPTYEIYFTGCSLRCAFCSVSDAVRSPEAGEWLPPAALAEAVAAPDVPPFSTVSLVGGEPTVNLPYLRLLLPELRRRLPGVILALNTNLFLSPERVAELAAGFDWIVGDVHFWSPDCAERVAGVPAYPQVARRAAGALLEAGARLLLRLLVLPGHLDCCLRPTVRWAASLPPDRLLLHVMTHYVPFGAARRHAELGRMLSAAEEAEALALVPPDVPRPRATPRAGVRPRPPEARDPAVPAEVDPTGRIVFPLVTGDLLPVVVRNKPELAERLVYSRGDPPPATPASRSDHAR